MRAFTERERIIRLEGDEANPPVANVSKLAADVDAYFDQPRCDGRAWEYRCTRFSQHEGKHWDERLNYHWRIDGNAIIGGFGPPPDAGSDASEVPDA